MTLEQRQEATLRAKEAATQRTAAMPVDLLARKDKDMKTRQTKMLYDQGGHSLLETYQQKQMAIGNHEGQKWPGVIVGHEMMSSVNMPGTMSRAEYKKFYNWMEPDTVTRQPLRVYKPAGVQPMMYDVTHMINNVIIYKYKDQRLLHKADIHVKHEPH